MDEDGEEKKRGELFLDCFIYPRLGWSGDGNPEGLMKYSGYRASKIKGIVGKEKIK